MKKQIIDERQEHDMYVIEHYGFWMAFWGLLAMILIQLILGKPSESFIYEWLLFMILAVSMTIGCAKKGIWSPKAKPSQKEYIKTAIIVFGAVVCLLLFIQAFRGEAFGLFTIMVDLGCGLFGAIVAYSVSFMLGEKIKKDEEKE